MDQSTTKKNKTRPTCVVVDAVVVVVVVDDVVMAGGFDWTGTSWTTSTRAAAVPSFPSSGRRPRSCTTRASLRNRTSGPTVRTPFTGFYWVLMGSIRFQWILLGSSGFYWVLLGSSGFYWVLLGSNGF